MVAAFGVSMKVTMVVTFYLFLKAWGTAFIQGYKSGKAGERTEEDLKFYGHPGESASLTAASINVDPQLVAAATRWRRIVQNDVENLPIAMILATFAGSVSVFETQEYVHLAAYLIYAVSRTLWTFAYAYSAQPWRSIFFVIAITAEITIGINGLVAVFKDVPVPQ